MYEGQQKKNHKRNLKKIIMFCFKNQKIKKSQFCQFQFEKYVWALRYANDCAYPIYTYKAHVKIYILHLFVFTLIISSSVKLTKCQIGTLFYISVLLCLGLIVSSQIHLIQCHVTKFSLQCDAIVGLSMRWEKIGI